MGELTKWFAIQFEVVMGYCEQVFPQSFCFVTKLM